jgi:subtilisin family serine protease
VVWPDTQSLAGRYISTGGTSIASPTVTGIVALLLEVNPRLSWLQVRSLLQESAINDVATGTIGTNYNNSWGAGKVNALGAVKKLLGVGVHGVEPDRQPAAVGNTRFTVVPGPRSMLTVSCMPAGAALMQLHSMSGRSVAKFPCGAAGNPALNVSGMSKGWYLVRAVGKTGRTLGTASVFLLNHTR